MGQRRTGTAGRDHARETVVTKVVFTEKCP
jgi:hypothetical protein